MSPIHHRLLLILMLMFCPPVLADTAESPGNPYSDLTKREIEARLAQYPAPLVLPWYQIELLVFKQNIATHTEFWRVGERPDYRTKKPLSLITPDEQQQASPSLYGAWQQLTEEAHYLTDMKERMIKQGYEVLYHNAWRQPVNDKNNTQPILIQNDMLITDRYELEGTFEIAVERYLHAVPNLWLSFVADDGRVISTPLRQPRRMRSDEVHYLDHPLFGVIVRVTPWEAAHHADISQLKQALDK